VRFIALDNVAVRFIARKKGGIMGKVKLSFVMGLLGVVFLSTQALAEEQRWAIDVHGGVFSLTAITNQVIETCPNIDGTTGGVALHYFGSEGPNRILRHVFSFDYASADGRGAWETKGVTGTGAVDFTLMSFCYTPTWHFLPDGPVNPYLGFGLGVGYLEGKFKAAGQAEEKYKGTVPVLHIPLGVNFKASENIWLKAEAGFRNGVYYTGAVEILF